MPVQHQPRNCEEEKFEKRELIGPSSVHRRPAGFLRSLMGCGNGWVNFGALMDRLRRVRGQTLSYPCLRHHSIERSRNVGRPDFLDICSSGSAVGGVCAVSHQNQYCEVFSGRHPGRNHRRSSGAPIGIAAHEAGHALQDAVDYFPLEARTYIVPVVQLASQTAPWLFIAGVMLQLPTLAWVGVILFGASSVFALITLPVEFNASARAQELLIGHGIILGDEQIAGVQKVLGAAAWTYVAAAVSAIGSWLFYVFVLLSQTRSTGFRR